MDHFVTANGLSRSDQRQFLALTCTRVTPKKHRINTNNEIFKKLEKDPMIFTTAYTKGDLSKLQTLWK